MWVAFGCFALAYLAFSRLGGGWALSPALLAAGYLAIPTMAVWSIVRTTRSTIGVERRVWTYLAGAVALLAFGDLAWIAGQLLPEGLQQATERVAYISYAAANIPLVLYVGTLLSSAMSGAPLLTKVRYSLDLAIAVLFVSALAVVAIFLPQYPGAGPELGLWVLNCVLTLAGILAFITLLGSVLESRERLWLRWEPKILAAVGLFVLADVITDAVSGYQALPLGSAPSVLTDVVWMSGYFMLAVAASQRIRAWGEPVALPSMAHARRGRLRWYDIGISTSLVLAVPLVLVEARYGRLGDAEYWTLGVAAFATAALVITRSVVLTSENGNLLTHTVVDPLTGAYNHRFFQERVEDEVERARRSSEHVSVVLLDVDEFSAVNESLGHQRGDRCLVRLSEVLRMLECTTDTVCRMGGDEFAVIMPSTTAEEAAQRARQMQLAFASDPELAECVGTVSVGVAASPEHATDRTALVAKAEGALYWARATGVGNIVVYDQEVVQALSPEERLHMAEEQSYMQTVEALAAAVDARDEYTQNHSRNVSRLAGRLAMEMGLPGNRAQLVEIAGLLHDVGKIGIPDAILKKPGRLTDEERHKIEEHPDLGQRILNATVFKEILPWVLSHHERWDGTGYPQGLLGEEIPLEARLLATCDAYDAMVSDRPYREGLPHALAVAEIERGAGSQFDPQIASVFVRLCAAGQIRPMQGARRPAPAPHQDGSLAPELG